MMADADESTEVLYAVNEDIALVTLNRPHRNNSWTNSMGTLYFDTLQRAADDPEVRAIVVTGAGRSFCPGADMLMLDEIERTGENTSHDPRPLTFPLSIPKPIFAAINGPCAGVGLIQAIVCDFRVTVPTVQISTAFARIGLVAAHGLAWMLPRLVGHSMATDLLMSGRKITADEAREIGLVSEIIGASELVETCIGRAKDLVRDSSPTSLGIIKRQLQRCEHMNLADAADEAQELAWAAARRPDFSEGLEAFARRRRPAFAPLDPSVLPSYPY